MSRTRAFFLEEATECLEAARAELAREIPDRAALHRAVRRLRGSAQLARFVPVARQAGTLEARVRPSAGDEAWTGELAREAAEELEGLEAAVEAVRRGEMESGEEMGAGMEDETTGEVVGMEELEYRGNAALERAMDLRQAVEDAIVTEAPAGPLLDELFDLIRLGMK